MRKRKHRYGSWADAESAASAHQKAEAVLCIALRELVTGKVKWLDGEQPRKIGLCKLGAAHGGVVILVEREYINARYLEEWLGDVQQREAPPGTRDYMPEYKAWLDIRRLAAAAKTEQEQAKDKAAQERQGCQRSPIAPIVDQDVRTY